MSSGLYKAGRDHPIDHHFFPTIIQASSRGRRAITHIVGLNLVKMAPRVSSCTIVLQSRRPLQMNLLRRYPRRRLPNIWFRHQYATATEVDGIHRILDKFMKAREEHNQRMQFNVDKILQNINSSPELQRPNPLEDKGSNFKGKNQTANQGQQHPHTSKIHKSQHFDQGNQYPNFYCQPPPQTRAY